MTGTIFSMAPRDAVDRLNRCLDRSPYLLDNNEKGARGASVLDNDLTRIVERQRMVEERFSQQSGDIKQRIEGMLGTRLVFESNALESTGLPLAATQAAIAEAPSAPEKLAEYIARIAVEADRHLIEVLGLHQATQFARRLAFDYANSAIPIREIDVRFLHQATVPNERFAGSYRSVQVEIEGSSHVPPAEVEVPRQMQQLVEWLNETDAPPPLAASVVHSWLTIIHPFQDGNGRVARLLANVVLFRSNWPALIIPSSDRLQYLDALSASDEAGNLLPLFDLFVKSIQRTLTELEEPNLAGRLFEADLKRDTNLRYRLWSEQLNEFLDELRRELRLFDFEIFRLAVPAVSTFMLLEEGNSAGNTWLAKVRGKGIDLLVWLGYMSHEMRDSRSASQVAPSLFVSERDTRVGAIRSYKDRFRHGSPIDIDEVSLVPGFGEKQGLLRRGRLTVTEHSPTEAAVLLARSISSLSK